MYTVQTGQDRHRRGRWVELTDERWTQFRADVRLTRSVRSMEQLTRAFSPLWGEVSLERSEIVRTIENDHVPFAFCTSGESLTHRGAIVFRGEPVQKMLNACRTS